MCPKNSSDDKHPLIGSSLPMLKLQDLIRRVGDSRVAVLLEGESGTGKEVVAQMIYKVQPLGAFIPIDCGALNANILESELFGHTRGAFTGAIAQRTGLLAAAHNGTAFFDEIGELPMELQAKLLRVLQQQEIRPVGSNHILPCKFRIIAATNRRLKEEVRKGNFREDLFYRINVVRLELPPLRDRKEDIPDLIAHFIRSSGGDHILTPTALAAIMAHNWPGNVRELQNCVARLMVLASNEYLNVQDLQLPGPSADSKANSLPEATSMYSVLPKSTESSTAASHGDAQMSDDLPVDLSMQAVQRIAVNRALAHTGGSLNQTAKVLGIGRTTLYRILRDQTRPFDAGICRNGIN